MEQGVVLKDGARTDPAHSTFRMTSFLALSTLSSELHEPAPGIKIQSTADLPQEDEVMSGLSAFLVDQDYRQSVLQSMQKAALLPYHTAMSLTDQLIDNLQQLQQRLYDALVTVPARRINRILAGIWERVLPRRTRRTSGNTAEAVEEEGALSLSHPAISFVDLYEMNVTFTDNYGLPLYDFRQNRNRYGFSKTVVDPLATDNALEAIRECADRAHNLPSAEEGLYAGIPLSQVLGHVQEEDLQGFLYYVSAYPGNYIGRNLKISETFATWVIYGAPSPEE